ncbi:hypothetical protein MHYP_G00087280 [Metynnis hypsauchen]
MEEADRQQDLKVVGARTSESGISVRQLIAKIEKHAAANASRGYTNTDNEMEDLERRWKHRHLGGGRLTSKITGFVEPKTEKRTIQSWSIFSLQPHSSYPFSCNLPSDFMSPQRRSIVILPPTVWNKT